MIILSILFFVTAILYSSVGFGGVVPELAARSHIEKIDWIVKKAIDESGRKIST